MMARGPYFAIRRAGLLLKSSLPARRDSYQEPALEKRQEQGTRTVKNLTEALRTEGISYKLLSGREVKSEIPV